MNCLAEISNRRYRIELDESWYHAVGEDREANRLWFELIPCAKGAFIYLYSENPPTLALFIPRPKKAKSIAATVPECKLDMMDGEAVIYFPPEVIHKIARLAGARRKRKLSPEHKAKLMESNKPYRFKCSLNGSKDQKTAQI